MEFTEERENFVKLSYIILDFAAKHLRFLFIKKWNDKYNGQTYPNQQWNSDATSGKFLYNELPSGFRNGKGNTEYVIKMETGNEQEWDTTTLVKVMLDCGLNLVQGCRSKDQRSIPFRPSEEIEIIRKYRNGLFAHMPKMSCTSNDFKRALSDIKSAAKNLFGEDAEKEVDEIQNWSIDERIIERLEKLVKMEKDLKQHVEKFNEMLNGKLSQINFISFC